MASKTAAAAGESQATRVQPLRLRCIYAKPGRVARVTPSVRVLCLLLCNRHGCRYGLHRASEGHSQTRAAGEHGRFLRWARCIRELPEHQRGQTQLDLEEKVATKIQSVYRGHCVRHLAMPQYKHHVAMSRRWTPQAIFRALVARQNELETAVDTYRRAQRVQANGGGDPSALRTALRSAVKRLTLAKRMAAVTGGTAAGGEDEGGAPALTELAAEGGDTSASTQVSGAHDDADDAGGEAAAVEAARATLAASGRQRSEHRRRALWAKLNSARGASQATIVAGIISDLHDIADLGALSSEHSTRDASHGLASERRGALGEEEEEEDGSTPLRSLDDERGYYYRQALNEGHFQNFLRDCGLTAHNRMTPVHLQRLFARHATVHRAEAEVVHARRRFHEHVNEKGSLPSHRLFSVARACGLDLPRDEVEEDAERMPAQVTWSRFYRWFDERRRLAQEFSGTYDHDGQSPGSAAEVLFSAMDFDGFLQAMREVAGLLYPPSPACACAACTRNKALDEAHGRASGANSGPGVGTMGLAYLGLGADAANSTPDDTYFVPWASALHDAAFARSHLDAVLDLLVQEHLVPSTGAMEAVGVRGAASPLGQVLLATSVRRTLCDHQAGLRLLFSRYAEGGSGHDGPVGVSALTEECPLAQTLSYVNLRRMLVDLALLPDLIANDVHDGFMLLSLASAARAGNRSGQHHRHVYYNLPTRLGRPRRCLVCGAPEYRLHVGNLHRLLLAFSAWDDDGDGRIHAKHLQDFFYAVGMDVDVNTAAWSRLLEEVGAGQGQDALVAFDTLVGALERTMGMSLAAECLALTFPEFVHFLVLLADTTLTRSEFSGMLPVDASPATRLRFLLSNIMGPLFQKMFSVPMRNDPPPLVLYTDTEFAAVQAALERMLSRTHQLYCRLGGAVQPTHMTLKAFQLWTADVGLFSSLPEKDVERVFQDAVDASAAEAAPSPQHEHARGRAPTAGSLSRQAFLQAVEALLKESFALGQRGVGLLDMQAYSLPIAIHTGLTPEGLGKRSLLERLNLLFSLYQPPGRQGSKALRGSYAIASPGSKLSPGTREAVVPLDLREGHASSQVVEEEGSGYFRGQTLTGAPSRSLLHKSILVLPDQPHHILSPNKRALPAEEAALSAAAGKPVDGTLPAAAMLAEHSKLLQRAPASRGGARRLPSPAVQAVDSPTAPAVSQFESEDGEGGDQSGDAAEEGVVPHEAERTEGSEVRGRGFTVTVARAGRGGHRKPMRVSVHPSGASRLEQRKRSLRHSVLLYLRHAIEEGVTTLDPSTLASLVARQKEEDFAEAGEDSDESEGKEGSMEVVPSTGQDSKAGDSASLTDAQAWTRPSSPIRSPGATLSGEDVIAALPERPNPLHRTLKAGGDSLLLARKVVGTAEWRRSQLSRWLSPEAEQEAASALNDMVLLPRVPVVELPRQDSKVLSDMPLRRRAKARVVVRVQTPTSLADSAAATASSLSLFVKEGRHTPPWFAEQYTLASFEEQLFHHAAAARRGAASQQAHAAMHHSAVAGKTTVLKSRAPTLAASRKKFLEARRLRLEGHMALLQRMRRRALTAEVAALALREDPAVEDDDIPALVARTHAVRRASMAMVYHQAALASFEEAAALTAEHRADEEEQRDDARLKKTLVRLHRLAARSELQRIATDRIGGVTVKDAATATPPSPGRRRRGSVLSQYRAGLASPVHRSDSPGSSSTPATPALTRGATEFTSDRPYTKGGASYIPSSSGLDVFIGVGSADLATSLVPLSVSTYTLTNAVASDGASLLADGSGRDPHVQAALVASQRLPMVPELASPALVRRLAHAGATVDETEREQERDLEDARVGAFMAKVAGAAGRLSPDPNTRPSAQVKAEMAKRDLTVASNAHSPASDGRSPTVRSSSDKPAKEESHKQRRRRRVRRGARRAKAKAAAEAVQQDQAVAALVHAREGDRHLKGAVASAKHLLQGDDWRFAWRRAQHERREAALAGHPSRVLRQEASALQLAKEAKAAEAEALFARAGVEDESEMEVRARRDAQPARVSSAQRVASHVLNLKQRHRALQRATASTSTLPAPARAPLARAGDASTDEHGMPTSTSSASLHARLSHAVLTEVGKGQHAGEAQARATAMGAAQHGMSLATMEATHGSAPSVHGARESTSTQRSGTRALVDSSIRSASTSALHRMGVQTHHYGRATPPPVHDVPSILPASSQAGRSQLHPAPSPAQPWTRPEGEPGQMRIAPSAGMATLLKGVAKRMGKWESQTEAILASKQASARKPASAPKQPAQPAPARTKAPRTPANTGTKKVGGKAASPSPTQGLSTHIARLKAQMSDAAAGREVRVPTPPPPAAPAVAATAQARAPRAPSTPPAVSFGEPDIWGSSSAYRPTTRQAQRSADVATPASSSEGNSEPALDPAQLIAAQQAAAPVVPPPQQLRPAADSKRGGVSARVNTMFGREVGTAIPHRPETRGQGRLGSVPSQDHSFRHRRGSSSAMAVPELDLASSLASLDRKSKGRTWMPPPMPPSEESKEASLRIAQAAAESARCARETPSSALPKNSSFAAAVRRAGARSARNASRAHGLREAGVHDMAASLSTSARQPGAAPASRGQTGDSQWTWTSSSTVEDDGGAGMTDPRLLPRAPKTGPVPGSGKRAPRSKGRVDIPVELVALRAHRHYTEVQMQSLYSKLIKQAINANKTPTVLTKPQEVSALLRSST